MTRSSRATRRVNGDLERVEDECTLYLSADKDWYITFKASDLAKEVMDIKANNESSGDTRTEGPAHAVWLNQDADITEVRLVKAQKFLELGCHPPKKKKPAGQGSSNPTNTESNNPYETDPTTLGFRC